MVWSIVKLRKSSRCAECKEPLAVGAMAFRPLTNGNNRMDRLCGRCVSVGREKLNDMLYGGIR